MASMSLVAVVVARQMRPLMRGGHSIDWSQRVAVVQKGGGIGRRHHAGHRDRGKRAVQPVTAISRRKDGHDGWYGRTRAQSRPRVLSPAREK